MNAALWRALFFWLSLNSLISGFDSECDPRSRVFMKASYSSRVFCSLRTQYFLLRRFQHMKQFWQFLQSKRKLESLHEWQLIRYRLL